MPVKFIIFRITGSNFYDHEDIYCENFMFSNVEELSTVLSSYKEDLHYRVKTKQLAIAQLYVVDISQSVVKQEFDFLTPLRTRLEVNKSAKSAVRKSSAIESISIHPNIWEMAFPDAPILAVDESN